MARGIAGPVGSLACNAERRECVLECEGEIDGPVPFTAAVRLRTRSARYGWNDVSHVSVLNNVGRDCMLEREREREKESEKRVKRRRSRANLPCFEMRRIHCVPRRIHAGPAS